MTIILGRHNVYPPGAVRVHTPRTGAGVWSPEDWWSVSGKTCVAAYQPKGAPSYADSKTNLADPGTYDAYEGSAPSWATGTGWTFVETKGLYTGINPSADWSLLVQIASWNSGISTRGVIGCGGQPQAFGILTYTDSTQCYAGGSVYSPDPITTGNIAIAGQKCYIDGAFSADIPTATGDWSTGIFIGGFGGVSWGAGVMIAAAIYSDTLTAGEVETVSDAMAGL